MAKKIIDTEYKITYKPNQETAEELWRLKEEEGRSHQWVIQTALDQYLKSTRSCGKSRN